MNSDKFDKVLAQMVVDFNAAEVFNRVPIDRYKRANKIIYQTAFPTRELLCACGCDKMRPSNRPRWATNRCKNRSFLVWRILCGSVDDIKWVLKMTGHKKCAKCWKEDGVELDHIIPVRAGGGGCWLDNYQMLCCECHKKKTKSDIALYGHRNKGGVKKELSPKQKLLRELRTPHN